MLLPNYTSAVRSTIKNRSVFFCDWDKHNQKIERLYRARNDLSHGKCSPLAPELRDAAELARQFARHVLIGTLWQSESARKSTKFSPLILEAALEEFHEKHKAREGMSELQTRVVESRTTADRPSGVAAHLAK